MIKDAIHSKRKEKNIYLTPEAIRKKNLKNKLWRYQDIPELEVITIACGLSVKNELRSLTRKLKLEFERRLAHNIKTSPKSFCSYVKTKTNTRSKIPPLKKTNNSEAVTSIDKAETLNTFLVVTLQTKDWRIYQTTQMNHF